MRPAQIRQYCQLGETSNSFAIVMIQIPAVFFCGAFGAVRLPVWQSLETPLTPQRLRHFSRSAATKDVYGMSRFHDILEITIILDLGIARL